MHVDVFGGRARGDCLTGTHYLPSNAADDDGGNPGGTHYIPLGSKDERGKGI